MGDTYAKLFTSMYTGSMYGAGLHVFATWGWILAHKDENGTVEINPELVADELGCVAQQINDALEYLCASDPNSRSKEAEGRRLRKVGQFAYQVINHAKYAKRGGSRTAYWREWRAKQREGATVAQRCAQPISTHVDVDVDVDVDEDEIKNVQSFPEDSVELRLARLLRDLIVERQPKARARRADMHQWACHIEKLIRIDERTPDEIESVIRWARSDTIPRGPRGFCWANNLLSPKSLRQKFDQLEANMQTQGSRSVESPGPNVAPLARDADGLTPRQRVLAQEGHP